MVIRSVAKAFFVSQSARDALPPLFLAPALATPVASFISSGRSFSLSPVRSKGQRRKGAIQKQRGVSAIRRTGPQVPLSVHKYELPRPVLDPEARKDFKFNPDHGLWGFFNKARTAISAPEEELAHGRPWTYQELSYKSFEDLHALYWVCIKERNRIATAEFERIRIHAGYGQFEAESRDGAVKKTMREIRKVLVDRWHSWQEMQEIVNGGGDIEALATYESDKGTEVEDDDLMPMEEATQEPQRRA